MFYLIAAFSGMLAGAIAVYLALESKRKRLEAIRLQQASHARKLNEILKRIQVREEEGLGALRAKREELRKRADQLKAALEKSASQERGSLEVERKRLMEQIAASKAAMEKERARLGEEAAALNRKRAEFDARVISYGDLQNQERILKRDLHNLSVRVRTGHIDQEKIRQVASKHLLEKAEWLISSLTEKNFVKRKKQLQQEIEWCREVGYQINADEEKRLLLSLRDEFRRIVSAASERERQRRLKEKIREEQMREKELERGRQQAKKEHEEAERQRAAVAAAYEQAIADAQDQQTSEVEELRAKLEQARARLEAVEETERAISRAEMTKTGHVYVISNVGSLGEGVFKIGMTRRLEPMDRIKELGDASVPFPFDVHMMISSEDAPGLESVLHRAIHKTRINKVNPRKEFFRTTIDTIYELVKGHHGEVEYIADSEALEYRQSVEMSDEDQDFIEGAYDETEDDGITEEEQ